MKLARKWLAARRRAERAALSHSLSQERLRQARLELNRFAVQRPISIVVDGVEVRVLEDGTVLLPEVFTREER